MSLLSEQDRSQWDAAEIAEGLDLVREALQRRPPGRFALMAAIAAVHAEAPTWSATDWSELVGLYDLLVVIWPSPVVALNRAVALGFAEGPEVGLRPSTSWPASPSWRPTPTCPRPGPICSAGSDGPTRPAPPTGRPSP